MLGSFINETLIPAESVDHSEKRILCENLKWMPLRLLENVLVSVKVSMHQRPAVVDVKSL